MTIVSIKRLVLTLILGLGSVMTLPAYAWPDTDEMNMCGAAVKSVRSYSGDHSSWAAHDNYVAHLGKNYYQRTNCPESKATDNYKGKNRIPDAKMCLKPRAHKKHMYKMHANKQHKSFHHKKHHKKYKGHTPNHKNHADCIRTDGLNKSGAIVKKASCSVQSDGEFIRKAYALLNMSKVKRVSKVHNPNHKNHADCVRTDGLNNGSVIIKVVRRR